ncbi:hypothetical protein [Flagellimonas sediminis]|uniref:Outer membrane protein beta-barrel domain-containing protein n=1 Tax=Flagellimonas sediminis TaxID=2696468 RepID=A0A6I5KVB6_9FLAO|nr:hypothetical protein [Allomuricauda sediminis]NDV44914.1 hypothetical protein [Allomuricauda sediminis]
MKKLLFVMAFAMLCSVAAKAQTSYKAALGLGIDAIDNSTFVGATGKYFFTANHVGQADLGFESNATIITVLYSYHKSFRGAPGLRWYVGAGPSIILRDGDNSFALRPHLGLDYKINGVPIVLNFDWRPFVGLGDAGNEVGAFGLGLQFAF